MRLTGIIACFVAVLVVSPVLSQETCKVSAQSAFAAAGDYRLAVGRARTSCTKNASDCALRRQEAIQLFDSLSLAHQVMLASCQPGGGGGGVTPTSPGQLVITEIMVSPNAVSAFDGQWFEIYNPTSLDLNLNGLTVRNDSGQTFAISTSIAMPPGGFVVLGRNGDPNLNGGVSVNYAYPSEFALAQASGGLTVLNGSTIIDYAPYASGQSGRSRNLSPTAFDSVSNDNLANWCNATGQLPSGDFGTPGYMNSTCF